MIETPNASQDQEILWHLEFDGSVNKLGVGQECGSIIHRTVMQRVMLIN